MKKLTLICVLAMLCLQLKSFAQQATSQALFTSQHIPDIELTRVLNYDSPNVTLSEFQGGKEKLVIFDFWGTHCINCIRQFPKLMNLQSEFGSKLQIVLVTKEPSSFVEAFIKKWEEDNHSVLTLPIVTEDTILHRYFRFLYQPHYVWIDTNNALIAQTGPSVVNKEVLSAYLSTKTETIQTNSSESHLILY